MKKVLITMSVLALSSTAFSQSELDAFKYAQGDLNGTARYLAMGGAFGALGGDVSAMNSNPAGLAIYRSSEVVATLSLSSISAKTDWLGTKETTNRTKMSFDNIAYVGYFPTSNDVGIVSWNVGFSYNRLKNYRRNYTASAAGGTDYSLSDYVAARATAGSLPVDKLRFTDNYNPYDPANEIGDWLSILGYDAGYMEAYSDNKQAYYSTFSEPDGTGYKMSDSRLQVHESGAVDQYDISAGVNISNLLMLGATVAITDLNYDYISYYSEDFVNGNYLTLGNPGEGNWLSTDGTGYSFNIGAILLPADFLRVGVAYNSPIWYKMTDTYQAAASTDVNAFDKPLTSVTPKGAATDYEFRAPDKWLFSVAGIFGKTALLSVDYEMVNYKNMRMYDAYGNSNQQTNGFIKEDFGMGNTLRVGAEVKVTPQFAVRAGASWSDSPLKDPLKNGEVEVMTVGTIPNYTIDKGITNYTVGLGYRFTPNFYTDIACVFKTHKEDLYAFSNMFDEKGDYIIQSQSASLKTHTTRVALTLGYKF